MNKLCIFRGSAAMLAEWLFVMEFKRVRVWHGRLASSEIEARDLAVLFNQLSNNGGVLHHRAVCAKGDVPVSDWSDCLVVLHNTTVFGNVRRCVYWEPD